MPGRVAAPVRFVVAEGQRRSRIDKVLPPLLEMSRATVQRWIEEGRVLVGGVVCRPKDEVRAGDVIEVEPGAPPPTDVVPDASVPFDVLYEDAELLVVDKPSGIVVHPGRGNWDRTLVAGLLARGGFERGVFDERDPMGHLRPGIVHRIDKNTSGVLVVAKSDRAREGLKTQLAEHSVERVYRAITVGIPAPGRIESLHARHPSARRKFTSKTDRGRHAVTHVALDEVLAGGRAALLSCRLETGRTHQIRVHLSEQKGTPILSDKVYGKLPSDPRLAAVATELGRQALHAAVLGFTHPVSGERVRFESPLPADMQLALEQLRAPWPGLHDRRGT
ncbi:MAG TPA: RluA family pseudouridine synthase [Polyangiaceae bacterium]|jgi:23S rRNA pseudouridine1911/1915/1917 synthase|nr:RluA family pseudouridine synthase [Polyangiaceae bacterium]